MKKVKKSSLIVACILIMSLSMLFVSCAKDTGSSADTGGADTGDASSSADGDVWEGVSYSIDMQCHQSSTEQLTSSYGHMVSLIDQVTNGAVQIKAYESGKLYSTADCFEAVSSGELIMCEAAEGSWYDNVPVTLLGAGLPFIYSSNEQAYMFMVNRGFVDVLNEAYAEHNIHMIPYECYTTSIISKEPITDVESIKGMKLRASGSMALYEDLVGAAVTNVSGSELYSALSTGIVDGASWGSAQAMIQMNLQEVATYYMDPDPVFGQWNCIYVNLDWWNGLTADQQNSLESAIQIAGYNRTIATAANNVLAKKVFTEKYDVTIQTLDQDAIDEFSEYGMQLVEQFAQNDEYSAKAVTALKDFLAEYETGEMVYNNQISFN
jgi:TRAP-type C4-dicarboxylate transport system substrate-binding protein